MIMSKMNKKNYKLGDLDVMYPAQEILKKSGELVQYESGIYGYGNCLTVAQRNIEDIIRNKLKKINCSEVNLPVLQPSSIWKESGRWDKYTSEDAMFVLSANNKDYCLAPTAEEAMVQFVRNSNISEKNLPFTYYQFGNKYRNEIRTRGYLLRGKSFRMFDGYSFCKDEKSLNEEYSKVRNQYIEVFKELGTKFVPVAAVNGDMGGKSSEEFMIISDLGEDTILYDKEKNIGINKEVLEIDNSEEYLKKVYGIVNVNSLQPQKAIEVGHIFKLGDNYSKNMNLNYIGKDNSSIPINMGCYGIGVSRLLASIYEENVIYEKNIPVGISLPYIIAPYVLYIITGNNDEKTKEAFEIYRTLEENDLPVIIDDRKIGIGQKIRECKAMGIPYMSIFGNKTEKNIIELESTKNNTKINLSRDELYDLFISPRKTAAKKLERRL